MKVNRISVKEPAGALGMSSFEGLAASIEFQDSSILGDRFSQVFSAWPRCIIDCFLKAPEKPPCRNKDLDGYP